MKEFRYYRIIYSTMDNAIDRTKRVDEVKEDILEVLEASEQPLSTQDIAEKLGRPWHSVQTRCLKLQIENRINGFKVGRVNLWMIKK